MNYQVEFVTARPTVLAAVRRETPRAALGATIIAGLNTVYAFLKTAPVRSRGINVVIYLDGQMTIEVGVQVAEAFADAPPVRCITTPAGPAAHTTHWGDYAKLGDANAAIHAWVAAHGRRLAGPSWEVYGHHADEPAQRRTDVYYLLADV